MVDDDCLAAGVSNVRPPVGVDFLFDNTRFQFSNEWFDGHTPSWQKHILQRFANQPIRVLEIGCWEGRSTCWMLQNLTTHPDARLLCIDPFDKLYDFFLVNKERFLRNVLATGLSAKMRLVQERSDTALTAMLAVDNAPRFHVIYVDGSHLRIDVLTDATLCWRLLEIGGVMVFDDYEWNEYRNNMACHPKDAVDAFCKVYAHKINVISKGYQLMVERTEE